MLKKLLSLSIGQQMLFDASAAGGLPIYGIVALMFLLLGYTQQFLQLVVGIVLVYVILILIRTFYFKARPNKQTYANKLEKIDASSFPSLHAMRATVLVLIVGKFFNNALVSYLLVAVLLEVCIARVLLKKHYWSDVSFGVIFGLVIGYLIKIIL